jgi:hypothetical protein
MWLAEPVAAAALGAAWSLTRWMVGGSPWDAHRRAMCRRACVRRKPVGESKGPPGLRPKFLDYVLTHTHGHSHEEGSLRSCEGRRDARYERQAERAVNVSFGLACHDLGPPAQPVLVQGQTFRLCKRPSACLLDGRLKGSDRLAD